MIKPEKEKVIVMDIDGCLCEKRKEGLSYDDLKPNASILNKLMEYKKEGFYIILYTSRNMNTYDNNLGLINANTAKTILDWLERWEILYDEIYFGKPWSGFKGFYVDDKAIRPTEFLSYDYEQIMNLLEKEEDVEK